MKDFPTELSSLYEKRITIPSFKLFPPFSSLGFKLTCAKVTAVKFKVLKIILGELTKFKKNLFGELGKKLNRGGALEKTVEKYLIA